MIRIGIAGLAHRHVEYAYAEVARRRDVVIEAVSDPEPVARDAAARRFNVPGYANHGELLSRHQVDVVVAAGEYASRGAVIADSLLAGAHVLADKPMCTSSEDADQIQAAWRAGDRELSMMLEKRWWPAVMGLREVIDSESLGDPVLFAAYAPHRLRPASRPTWFFDRKRYGGILADLAIHDLHLLTWLTGTPGGVIQGWAGNRAVPNHGEFEDHGLAVFRADDGLIATVAVDWLTPEAADHDGAYQLRVTGTAGIAEAHLSEGRLLVTTRTRPRYEPVLPAGAAPAADFFDAITKGTRPSITGDEAIATTRLALAAAESAASGSCRRRWDAHE